MDKTANRIKEAMELRGMKQTDLAAKTGIGKSSISTYLSGAYKPKQQNLYLIAKALNVNIAWLMGKDVPMDPVVEAYITGERTNVVIKMFSNDTEKQFERTMGYVKNFRDLTDEGQEMAVQYLDMLKKSGY